MRGSKPCGRPRDQVTDELVASQANAGVAGLESGAERYLIKPFDIDELDETLRHMAAAA